MRMFSKSIMWVIQEWVTFVPTSNCTIKHKSCKLSEFSRTRFDNPWASPSNPIFQLASVLKKMPKILVRNLLTKYYVKSAKQEPFM